VTLEEWKVTCRSCGQVIERGYGPVAHWVSPHTCSEKALDVAAAAGRATVLWTIYTHSASPVDEKEHQA
jgi:hypothetical protein